MSFSELDADFLAWTTLSQVSSDLINASETFKTNSCSKKPGDDECRQLAAMKEYGARRLLCAPGENNCPFEARESQWDANYDALLAFVNRDAQTCKTQIDAMQSCYANASEADQTVCSRQSADFHNCISGQMKNPEPARRFAKCLLTDSYTSGKDDCSEHFQAFANQYADETFVVLRKSGVPVESWKDAVVEAMKSMPPQ